MNAFDHSHAPGTEICFECKGAWNVTTSSGTAYRLDLDAKTATRVTNPARAGDDWESHEMRRDGERLPLYSFTELVIGHRAFMVVGELSGEDGYVATNRYTTPVTSVVPV